MTTTDTPKTDLPPIPGSRVRDRHDPETTAIVVEVLPHGSIAVDLERDEPGGRISVWTDGDYDVIAPPLYGMDVEVTDTYTARLVAICDDGKAILAPLHDGAPSGYTVTVDAERVVRLLPCPVEAEDLEP